MPRSHHQLRLWRESITPAKEIYQFTKTLLQDELDVPSAQMRRAALSVPCNVAEGAPRTGKKEFLQCLSVARGSLNELETRVIPAKKLGCINDNRQIMERIVNVFGLPGELIRPLKSRSHK